MFRSKLGALIFMGFILLAVFRVIGTEDASGDLATASERIASHPAPREQAPQRYDAAPNSPSSDLQDAGWGDEASQPAG